jgi:hypothetical protein
MTYSRFDDGSLTGMKLKIGVMGSASGKFTKKQTHLAFNLGVAIATRDCIMVTGACPGLPYMCAKGVKSKNGFVVGISPGLSLDEHIYKYNSPADFADVLIYTGSGLMGREITGIRSCDIVVIIGGRSGTLGEFAIAFDEGKLIGTLLGTGGISDRMHEIVESVKKDTGAQVIYEADPFILIDSLIDYYTNEHYKRPSIFISEHSIKP